MGKLKAFAEYVTKDQTPVEPDPVKAKRAWSCSHCGAPNDGDICRYCGVGVSVEEKPGTLSDAWHAAVKQGLLRITEIR